ncbi:MAG: zinc ABC transporter ATP-binding protein ZnuC [Candidatus Dasytiphilus stammeri]
MNILLNIKNIYVSINNSNIIYNVSFQLKSGQIVTLIGPNGAGKTTLIRVILGLITPNQGTIYIKKFLRIGYVPQTIIKNFSLPLSVHRFIQLKVKSKKNYIISILHQVGAEKLIDYPMQYLSQGQIQRVLLARALINKPQLLVLDEPTQGIDIKGQISFYNLINHLRNKFQCGILIVSHDLYLVMAHTDEVLCLNKHICCSGTPEKVSLHSEFINIFGYSAAHQLGIYQHNSHHNYQHY